MCRKKTLKNDMLFYLTHLFIKTKLKLIIKKVKKKYLTSNNKKKEWGPEVQIPTTHAK